MAYWWVSQNKTFREESAGGFLWAPKRKKGGNTPHHWETMTTVEPGDVILSFYKQEIVAVSVAKDKAYDFPRPFAAGGGIAWERDGRRLDAEYELLEKPVSVPRLRNRLIPLMPEHHGPLTKYGTGNQGYLFPLPVAAAELILGEAKLAAPDGRDPVVQAVQRLPLDQTTKKALVESRIGQGRFRNDLIAMWAGKCAVTGLAVTSLLRASHSKPWRPSNNVERLDPYNGFLLAPSYDAAFDTGLISFTDKGRLIISKALNAAALKALGINAAARLRDVHPQHRAYLGYHREHVFKP